MSCREEAGHGQCPQCSDPGDSERRLSGPKMITHSPALGEKAVGWLPEQRGGHGGNPAEQCSMVPGSFCPCLCFPCAVLVAPLILVSSTKIILI